MGVSIPKCIWASQIGFDNVLKKKKEEHEVGWREESGSGSGRRERASEVNIFTMHHMNVSKNYYLQCLISTEIERKYAPKINMQMNGI